MDDMTIGEQIRVLQKRHGYSLLALSRMAGMSNTTLQKIVDSDKSVALQRYCDVAKVFDKQIKITVE